MTWANLTDVENQLRAAGLLLESVQKSQGGTAAGAVYVESARSVRCDVYGVRQKGTGAYRLHELRLEDGIYISGCYWITGSDTPTGTIELRKTCVACGYSNPLRGAKCESCGKAKFKKHEMSPEQLAAHKARIAETKRQAEADRQAAIDKCAQWATAVWRGSQEATLDAHDYYARKGLAATGGARIFPGVDGLALDGAEKEDYKWLAQFAGALVIPICDPDARVMGVQFILSRAKHADWIKRHERDKQYWPRDFDKTSHYWLIGGTPRGVVLVAEGFATALSLHLATGLPVAVCFAANQNQSVGEALRKYYKKRTRILYCVDDDWLQTCAACQKYTPVETDTCAHCGEPHKKRNAGIYFGQAAALATDGAWVIPQFATPRPDNRKSATDFNDLHAAEGLQVVRAQIEQKLAALAWGTGASAPRISPLSGGSVATEGGGEGYRPPLKSLITVDEAAERFALLFGGKATLFDFEEHALIPKTDVLDILPPRAWDDLKRHPNWRAYRLGEVGFDPARNDTGIKCNLFGGWPTVAKKGNCERLLELLEYLCIDERNNREIYQWILKWLAYPIQHPGAKMKTALVFHGPQGAGKNLFFEAVMSIYGQYGRIIDQSAIEDKFNDWASRGLFFICDEVVARQELSHIDGKLKHLITGFTIRINPKNVTPHDERNHINLVFLSNELRPVPIQPGDRRFVVVWTPEKMPKENYDAISAEIDAGAIAALHDYLLHLDLGDFRPDTEAPRTDAKDELIERSMPPQIAFINDWQAGEAYLGYGQEDKALPFCPCLGSDLFDAYKKWCHKAAVQYPGDIAKFIGTIGKLPGWQAGRSIPTYVSRSNKTRKNRKMVIPSIDALADAEKHGNVITIQRRPADVQGEWLTECFFTFHDAMNNHRQ